jgi:hypothetical protein
MDSIFAQGFQHGFFYGAVAMALLSLGVWLCCSMSYRRPSVTLDKRRVKVANDGSITRVAPPEQACETCDGSGFRSLHFPMWDADDQPCPECNPDYSRIKKAP